MKLLVIGAHPDDAELHVRTSIGGSTSKPAAFARSLQVPRGPDRGDVCLMKSGVGAGVRSGRRHAARTMGLRRVLIPVPLLTPKLSSFWLILFTPLPYQLAAALVEGLKSETLVLNDYAPRYFPHITPRSYKEAIAAEVKGL